MPRPGTTPPEGAPEESFDLDGVDLPTPLAIRRKENYLRLQRRQEVEKGNRKLVDREAAEKLFFDTARDFRDAWLSWPARVAITMADELKVDSARSRRSCPTSPIVSSAAGFGARSLLPSTSASSSFR